MSAAIPSYGVDNWNFDSGASDHVTNELDKLTKWEKYTEQDRIHSPSTTMSCSIKGNVIEALHDPTVKASIMSQFLAGTLLGDMPLTPTDKLFTSPLGLIVTTRKI